MQGIQSTPNWFINGSGMRQGGAVFLIMYRKLVAAIDSTFDLLTATGLIDFRTFY